ncbi:unnamed protein product [Brassica rapa]|uniref:Uncharacterized protein n=2 Tax=Brassica TaxID=3705 RepID=A0A8D9DEB6_BRACM|nr:unnamed protein product [Brassica napus]CAG7872883.1 unnamed protein product [Brassica rapa]
MEETRKKKKDDSKKKERHIVTWSQQEDDILRKQITLHGTDNWAIIASNFTDKSTRQCRRRWYTYLNSDFKRGGWSPEEDTLLCEAQRVFGNRWTEIAKVVSGRTDNAVKNRFTTLCKKRAKYEAMAKDNSLASCVINSNNKRMLLPDCGISTPPKAESVSPLAKKMRRSDIPDVTVFGGYGDRSHIKVNSGVNQHSSYGDRSHIKVGSGVNQQIRPPCLVLAHNEEEKNQTDSVKESEGEDKEMFLKKDDPKVTSLMQQAELLSSLAQKVNADNTDQSMENAWKALQDFFNKSKENDLFRYGLPDIDFQLEEFKDLVEDLRSSNEDSQASWRQPDLHDSPASSDYSSGSTTIPHSSGDQTQQPMSGSQTETQLLPDNEQVDLLSTCHEIVPMSVEEEFNSPVQVTPLFRSLAAGIPSPQFSESVSFAPKYYGNSFIKEKHDGVCLLQEKNFVLKTLGVESPCPSANLSQPPPCKRVLLDSL